MTGPVDIPDDRAVVQSYARIFKPDRRIYAIEGHPLPVPGGVPLVWLGYAIGALLAVLVLSGRSWGLAAILSLAVGAVALVWSDRATALVLAVATGAGVLVAGVVVAALDWPLRLVVLPAAVATLLSQASPDGRPAHRYALSWLALRLRPPRRSLGRTLDAAGRRRRRGARLAVAPDVREWLLDRARVTGPATVRFLVALPVQARRSRRGGRWYCHPPRRFARGPASVTDSLELVEGERLELRP